MPRLQLSQPPPQRWEYRSYSSHMPQQFGDAKSCGVFLALAAMHRAAGCAFEYHQRDMPSWRNAFANLLLRNAEAVFGGHL